MYVSQHSQLRKYHSAADSAGQSLWHTQNTCWGQSTAHTAQMQASQTNSSTCDIPKNLHSVTPGKCVFSLLFPLPVWFYTVSKMTTEMQENTHTYMTKFRPTCLAEKSFLSAACQEVLRASFISYRYFFFATLSTKNSQGSLAPLFP